MKVKVQVLSSTPPYKSKQLKALLFTVPTLVDRNSFLTLKKREH